MAGNFEFHDYSAQVKAAIEQVCGNWLVEVANEVTSQAKRNVSMEGWTNAERTSLRDSYSNVVDKPNKTAAIGSTLEQAYWEEWGTGSHADTAKNGGKQGRQDWWVYTPGRVKPEGEPESKHYKTKEDAESAAAYIKSEYNKTAIATDGREPNYTLEKAFTTTAPRAKKALEAKLKSISGLNVTGTSGGGQKYE